MQIRSTVQQLLGPGMMWPPGGAAAGGPRPPTAPPTAKTSAPVAAAGTSPVKLVMAGDVAAYSATVLDSIKVDIATAGGCNAAQVTPPVLAMAAVIASSALTPWADPPTTYPL